MGIETDRDVALRWESAKARVPGGPAFWVAVLVGWGVMAYGIVGALGIAQDTHPRSLAIWLVGSLVAHDLLVAPAVFVLGRMLRGIVPSTYRVAVHSVLYVSAVLAIISVPVVGAFGARRDNPTLLPRNYAVGLLVALALTWAATLLVVLAAHRWKRATR